jgi:hypothetical protein
MGESKTMRVRTDFFRLSQWFRLIGGVAFCGVGVGMFAGRIANNPRY